MQATRGGVITEPHIKERLSMAYVDAVAGRAGINVSRALHDYGVDGTFHPVINTGSKYVETGFTVQFQLKATVDWSIRDSYIVYDLEAHAYNSMVMRSSAAAPLVLILMCLPRQEQRWLRQRERLLVLQNCCYWYWLPPGPPTANKATVRVSIPRSNALTAANLSGLLDGARAYNLGMQNHV